MNSKNTLLLHTSVLACSVFSFCFACSEPRSKSEWSRLQNVEYHNRDAKFSGNSRIIDYRGDYFLQVKSASNDNVFICVMLTSKTDPYYKQMPEGGYFLDDAVFQQVSEIEGVSEITLMELEKRLIEKK